MATLTKQPPRRRPQIFNDYDPAAIERALAKHDWLGCWSRQLMRDLAHAARAARQHKRYAGSVHRAVNRSPFLTTRLFLGR
jgi:hypothetical protein